MNTVWEWPGRYPNVRIIRLTGTPDFFKAYTRVIVGSDCRGIEGRKPDPETVGMPGAEALKGIDRAVREVLGRTE